MEGLIRAGNGKFNPSLVSLFFSLCPTSVIRHYLTQLTAKDRDQLKRQYREIRRRIMQEIAEGRITGDYDYCELLVLEELVGDPKSRILPQLFLADIFTTLFYGPQNSRQLYLAEWLAKIKLYISTLVHNVFIEASTGLKVQQYNRQHKK